MILIGVGSNLESAAGTPHQTCLAALEQLALYGITVSRCSPWYESAPVPASNQPWFVNGVVEVKTDQKPAELLENLHKIELAFSRARTVANAARTLDLDLLCYDNLVHKGGDGTPTLPHPRLHERAFVLLPLIDIAPSWIHPALGLDADVLVKRLPKGQMARRLVGSP